MNVRRVAALLGKELLYGPKSFLFVFAVAVPIVTSLIVSLLFGSLLAGKPRLGIVDRGDSQLLSVLDDLDFMTGTAYASEIELRQAVTTGAADMGLVLPAEVDRGLRTGEAAELDLFIYGQSSLRNRMMLMTAVGDAVVAVAGRETPAEVVPTVLGEGQNSAWYERLLPLLLLMAVVLGGSLVPATSLIDEKQKRTLRALVVTPVTVSDVFLAKGLLGVILSLLVGLVTLALNRAFGQQPGLLLLVMVMGASLAAAFGILLGAFIKDINTLFAVVKAMGVLLYAPGIIYLFPQLPQWVGKIIPTYYIVNPILTITQNGGGWADVAGDLAVLSGLIVVTLAAVAAAARRLSFR